MQIINNTKYKYDSLTKERKDKVKKLVVSTPDVCGGRARLFGHRLEIELIMYDYLSGENCYESRIVKKPGPKYLPCLGFIIENTIVIYK